MRVIDLLIDRRTDAKVYLRGWVVISIVVIVILASSLLASENKNNIRVPSMEGEVTYIRISLEYDNVDASIKTPLGTLFTEVRMDKELKAACRIVQELVTHRVREKIEAN